ncbi:spermidine/putrescine transport system permease protein [Lutimaribacter pacificus]|uniref:Spermidine/putrescine transport system permease protein n=1 Tax=Lutimaribacter pacificus TaxID=391948 RepID=A0A1H0IXM0_9RHOB|nr:ABC transporter permease [Lutimaribacter pacificus]SDO36185.1 spermidine/putrescine transport system permease protein [Lutimaribacter pacificus]SHK16478.1 spermidine/putrescine transport system permease protein [Lutimaribacter pacificus]
MSDAATTRATRSRWLLLAPALAVLVFAASGPLLIVLIYSFLTPGDYGGVVWSLSPDAWFSVVMEQDFFTEEIGFADAHLSIFWRSIKLSLMTALLTFVFGFPTAYFIATRPREKRDIWMLLIIIPFWTNLLIRTFAIMELIRAEGTVNSALLALGIIDEPIQMLFTEFAILLGMAYVYLPLMVLPIYASLERFDFTLVEAGYDLYASRWRVLRKVIFPLAKPGVIAGSILVFVPSLGAYVTPRVLGGGKQLMLGNLIELQFGAGRNWPLGAALSLTLLAIVMVALILYVRAAGNEEVRHG